MKIPEGKIQIRSSSLGIFAGCARFGAYTRDKEGAILAHQDIGDEGTKVRARYPMYMGTGFHRAAELGKFSEKEISECLKDAVGAEDQLPNFFDEKFTDLQKMEKVLNLMVAQFRQSPFAREWTDDRANSKYEIEVQSEEVDGVFWTGHVDCVNQGKVVDLKTTTYTTPDNLYVEQLTSYRLLLEQSGVEVKPLADVVKVSKPNTPNPRTPPKVARYSVDTALHETRVVELVKRTADLINNKDKWADNLNKVPCNPHSKTCSYCPLKNTSACKETQFTTHE